MRSKSNTTHDRLKIEAMKDLKKLQDMVLQNDNNPMGGGSNSPHWDLKKREIECKAMNRYLRNKKCYDPNLLSSNAKEFLTELEINTPSVETVIDELDSVKFGYSMIYYYAEMAVSTSKDEVFNNVKGKIGYRNKQIVDYHKGENYKFWRKYILMAFSFLALVATNPNFRFLNFGG